MACVRSGRVGPPTRIRPHATRGRVSGFITSVEPGGGISPFRLCLRKLLRCLAERSQGSSHAEVMGREPAPGCAKEPGGRRLIGGPHSVHAQEIGPSTGPTRVNRQRNNNRATLQLTPPLQTPALCSEIESVALGTLCRPTRANGAHPARTVPYVSGTRPFDAPATGCHQPKGFGFGCTDLRSRSRSRSPGLGATRATPRKFHPETE